MWGKSKKNYNSPLYDNVFVTTPSQQGRHSKLYPLQLFFHLLRGDHIQFFGGYAQGFWNAKKVAAQGFYVAVAKVTKDGAAGGGDIAKLFPPAPQPKPTAQRQRRQYAKPSTTILLHPSSNCSHDRASDSCPAPPQPKPTVQRRGGGKIVAVKGKLPYTGSNKLIGGAMTRQRIHIKRSIAVAICFLLGMTVTLEATEIVSRNPGNDCGPIVFPLPSLLLGNPSPLPILAYQTSANRNTLPPTPLTSGKDGLAVTINDAINTFLFGITVYACIANFLYGTPSIETGKETMAKDQHFDKFPSAAAQAYSATAEAAVRQALHDYSHSTNDLSYQ